MLKHRHPALESRPIWSTLDPQQANLTLDIVESNASPFVYVWRSLEQRVAVFGPDTPVSTPLFYNHPDDLVTLNALHAGEDVTVLGRTRDGRLIGKPITSPPRVTDLVKSLADAPLASSRQLARGVGLSYTRIVEVLSALCESKAIPGQLVMQQTTLTDLLAPTELPERPEGDEVPLLPDEPPDEPAGRGESDQE
jgi:hypothetical protein